MQSIQDMLPLQDTQWKCPKCRVHEFMFYQAMRKKKKRGGKRRHGEQDSGAIFNYEEFKEIREKYGQLREGEEMPDPVDPLGFDQVNTYKAALHILHDMQLANGTNSFVWEEIWTKDLKDLRWY